MKDIKSIIIGFLLATCMFLFMGATSNDNENQVGKYQGFTDEYSEYIIDTITGELWVRSIDGVGKKATRYWKKSIGANDFRND